MRIIARVGRPRPALAAMALVCGCVATPGDAAPTGVVDECPPGEAIQWIADYCMARIGTDDEIAASDCIASETQRVFDNACKAKLHYKRSMCELALESLVRPGSIAACVADRTFVGRTVRHNGVGH